MSVAQKFTSSSRVAVAVAFALCVATTGVVLAFGDGPPPGFTGGSGDPDCTSCHFDYEVNSPGGTITVTVLPDALLAGGRHQISISVEHPDLRTAGFQLAVRDGHGDAAGDLYAFGDGVQTVYEATTDQTYAQHQGSRAKDASSNAVQWDVVWEAPENGADVIIDVAVNASNDDGSPMGDHIYTIARKLFSAATSTTAAPAELEQYAQTPQPAQPMMGERRCCPHHQTAECNMQCKD